MVWWGRLTLFFLLLTLLSPISFAIEVIFSSSG
jgi:hypothetical protein